MGKRQSQWMTFGAALALGALGVPIVSSRMQQPRNVCPDCQCLSCRSPEYPDPDNDVSSGRSVEEPETVSHKTKSR
jgi:hypothetical protein